MNNIEKLKNLGVVVTDIDQWRAQSDLTDKNCAYRWHKNIEYKISLKGMGIDFMIQHNGFSYYIGYVYELYKNEYSVELSECNSDYDRDVLEEDLGEENAGKILDLLESIGNEKAKKECRRQLLKRIEENK